MKPKKRHIKFLYLICLFCLLINCSVPQSDSIPVIFDTDANNELDDQHALAYLLFNSKTFKAIGVTVNSTYNGGDIQSHYDEAKRVMQLCDSYKKTPLLIGAEQNFKTIKPQLINSHFDGNKAVDFIISEALKKRSEKLIILAVGKLTNIALAIKKNLLIKDKIKIVWLGSNYPDSGEYNLENDIESLNYVLKTNVEFEMAVCRYGKDSGADAVKVTQKDILENLKGKGLVVESVVGRHGGAYQTFGDYSVSLFENATYYGTPPSRSLFDMAAVAIVKNPSWAKSHVMPAPKYENSKWIEQPNNPRKITIWEYFNKDEILKDFYLSISNQ